MTLDELLNKYEIKDLKELEEILDDYDEQATFIVLIFNYLNQKDLLEDFKKFTKERLKKNDKK